MEDSDSAEEDELVEESLLCCFVDNLDMEATADLSFLVLLCSVVAALDNCFVSWLDDFPLSVALPVSALSTKKVCFMISQKSYFPTF